MGSADEGPTSDLEHGHHPDEIAERLANGPRARYLRDWVYGGIDGAVPGRPAEFHRQPPTDPDLTLSRHPARATV